MAGAMILSGCGGGEDSGEQATTAELWQDVDVFPGKSVTDLSVSDYEGKPASPSGVTWTSNISLQATTASAPDSSWPDAQEVFPGAEVQAMFPDAASHQYTNCSKGSYSSGGETSKNTRCTLELTFNDNPTPSTIDIRVHGFGWDAAATQRLATIASTPLENLERTPSLYKLFPAGSAGAKAIIRDSINYYVLFSDGRRAGIVQFTIKGFQHLGDNAGARDAAIQNQVVPRLANFLSAKLPYSA